MKDVYVLAFESSCDETSVSIVKNGYEEISTVVLSQMDIHANYGGVVPEIASRNHVENITMVDILLWRVIEYTSDVGTDICRFLFVVYCLGYQYTQKHLTI